MEDSLQFYEAVINAGAILAGFCSTFLVFRIQREANYHRQPAISFKRGKAKDIYIGLTHFTSSFLLIILAAICSMFFGFVIPLFGLTGMSRCWISPRIVVAGLIGSLVLLAGYLFVEMVHYRILSRRLVNDAREWGRETPVILVFILLALLVFYYLSG